MLEKILKAREERWQTRCLLGDKFLEPVISVTLNIPGPNKVKDSYLRVHKVIVEDYLLNLKKKGFLVLYQKERVSWDGPEAFLVVKGTGKKIKQLSIQFEENHPLGRLTDIDVLDKDKKNISRKDLKEQVRKCIICGEPVLCCILSKSHRQDQLLKQIDKLIATYFFDK